MGMSAIELSAIGGDDLRIQGLGHGDGQAGLARSGGAHNGDEQGTLRPAVEMSRCREVNMQPRPDRPAR